MGTPQSEVFVFYIFTARASSFVPRALKGTSFPNAFEWTIVAKAFKGTIVPESFKETIVLKAFEGRIVPKVDLISYVGCFGMIFHEFFEKVIPIHHPTKVYAFSLCSLT